MIQHVWSVLCKNVSIDAQTNVISLLNVIETIFAHRQPGDEKPFPVSLEILSLWTRDPENIPVVGEARITLVHHGEGIIEPIFLEINLSNSIFHRSRLTIGGLPIVNTGRFEFKIEHRVQGENEWKFGSTIPFFVAISDK